MHPFDVAPPLPLLPAHFISSLSSQEKGNRWAFRIKQRPGLLQRDHTFFHSFCCKETFIFFCKLLYTFQTQKKEQMAVQTTSKTLNNICFCAARDLKIFSIADAM
jgi:hypothetical protein